MATTPVSVLGANSSLIRNQISNIAQSASINNLKLNSNKSYKSSLVQQETTMYIPTLYITTLCLKKVPTFELSVTLSNLQIFCRYSVDMEENANKFHFKYTDFNSPTRVTVCSEECIYVFLSKHPHL